MSQYLTINIKSGHYSENINTFSVWIFCNFYKLQHTSFINEPCKSEQAAQIKGFEYALKEVYKIVKENPKKIDALVIKSEDVYAIAQMNSMSPFAANSLHIIKQIALTTQAGSIDCRPIGNAFVDKPTYVHKWLKEKTIQFFKFKL